MKRKLLVASVIVALFLIWKFPSQRNLFALPYQTINAATPSTVQEDALELARWLARIEPHLRGTERNSFDAYRQAWTQLALADQAMRGGETSEAEDRIETAKRIVGSLPRGK